MHYMLYWEWLLRYSIMKKVFLIPVIFQIWCISICMFLLMQIWNIYQNSSETWEHIEYQAKKHSSSNEQNFSSAYSSHFWTIGIALSTRVGSNFSAIHNANTANNYNGYYKEIITVWDTSEEKKAIRTQLLSHNMLMIQEYLNLSRNDIKSLLDSSNNRRSTLEGFISQLELRYKNAAISIWNLEKQKSLLLAELAVIDSSIQSIKSSMEENFSDSMIQTTLEDTDAYFQQRRIYTETFTDIVFINQFLKQYRFLNDYNKVVLDTLINNKEALINKSYVVIPDSWDEYLRPLELLFEESDFKAVEKSIFTE